jgi:hypothetical protein
MALNLLCIAESVNKVTAAYEMKAADLSNRRTEILANDQVRPAISNTINTRKRPKEHTEQLKLSLALRLLHETMAKRLHLAHAETEYIVIPAYHKRDRTFDLSS